MVKTQQALTHLDTLQQSQGFSSQPRLFRPRLTVPYWPNITYTLCCLMAFSTMLFAFSTSSELAPGTTALMVTEDCSVFLLGISQRTFWLDWLATSSSVLFLFRSFKETLVFFISNLETVEAATPSGLSGWVSSAWTSREFPRNLKPFTANISKLTFFTAEKGFTGGKKWANFHRSRSLINREGGREEGREEGREGGRAGLTWSHRGKTQRSSRSPESSAPPPPPSPQPGPCWSSTWSTPPTGRPPVQPSPRNSLTAREDSEAVIQWVFPGLLRAHLVITAHIQPCPAANKTSQSNLNQSSNHQILNHQFCKLGFSDFLHF